MEYRFIFDEFFEVLANDLLGLPGDFGKFETHVDHGSFGSLKVGSGLAVFIKIFEKNIGKRLIKPLRSKKGWSGH